MFPLPSRHVRRLRLGVAREDDAGHVATLLTDALATASLPGADDGRLIVIRRLALGRISLDASPSSLALRVADAAREILAEAVAYDLPSAGAANVVAFPDRGAAIVALARLRGRGVPAREWFWTAALPGHEPDAPAGECWLRLIEAAHELPQAAVVAAQVVEAAVAADAAEALLSSLGPGRAERWLRPFGWNTAIAAGVSPLRPLELKPRARAVLRRWREREVAADPRVAWLATMLAIGEQPARAADPALAARVMATLSWLTAIGTTGKFDRSQPEPTAAITPLQSDGESPAPAGSVRSERALDEPHTDRPIVDAESNETPSAGPAVRRSARAARAIEPRQIQDPGANDDPPALDSAPAGEFSPCAGLIFVVPVLERLGFSEYLVSRPALLDEAFPARLLDFIGRRAGLLPQEPIAAIVSSEPCEENRPFAVADLPDQARAMLSAPAPRGVLDGPLVAWLTAVRRFSRRQARMGLITLIRRPGRVRVSRTHVDVGFDLPLADVRLRRLALDVDPGWVPWLGRVVQFSYLDRP